MTLQLSDILPVRLVPVTGTLSEKEVWLRRWMLDRSGWFLPSEVEMAAERRFEEDHGIEAWDESDLDDSSGVLVISIGGEIVYTAEFGDEEDDDD